MMYGDIVLHISFMVWFGLDWIVHDSFRAMLP